MVTVRELEINRLTISPNNKHIVIVLRLQNNNSIFLLHLKWGADVSLKYRCHEKKSFLRNEAREASVGIRTFDLLANVVMSSSTTRGRTNHTEFVPQCPTVIFSSRQTCMFMHSGHFSQYTHHTWLLRHIYFYTLCLFYMFDIHSVGSQQRTYRVYKTKLSFLWNSHIFVFSIKKVICIKSMYIQKKTKQIHFSVNLHNNSVAIPQIVDKVIQVQ